MTIKAPLNPNQPAIYQWPGAILFSPTTGLLTEGCCFFHACSAKTIILDHVHRLHQKICSGQSSLYNSNIIVLLTCCGDVVHAFLGSMLAAAPVCHRVGQNTVGEVFDSSFPILQFFGTPATPPPQPFYVPFSRTTRVSRSQKRTSGLYGARED